MRHDKLVEYQRGTNIKKIKQQMKIINDNQVERFKIIKEQRESYLKLKREFESSKPSTIEITEKLDREKFYNAEYLLKLKKYEDDVKKYDEDIKKLTEKENAFLSEFLSYIEFHETALRMYRADFLELYTQFAFGYTDIREREDEQMRLKIEEHKRKVAEIEEELKKQL